MSTPTPAPAPRRADAERNRGKILAVARRLFEAGADARPELVAREAGVGVGTLYRHFATREALALAVYDEELRRVADAAAELLAQHPPALALRAWMDRFAERFERKHAMGEAMYALVRSSGVTVAATRARLAVAAQLLLDTGAADGSLRAGARGDDLVAALAGLCIACPDLAQRDRLDRLMGLLAAGLTA
ncbi:MAG TPA: helix-turn-helix domain-containing protein [Gryllotalpicola sp.]